MAAGTPITASPTKKMICEEKTQKEEGEKY
jgi:hypothetical protein